MSEREAEGGGGERRAAPGRAGASERRGPRDPTRGGPGLSSPPCRPGLRGAGIPNPGLSPGPGRPRHRPHSSHSPSGTASPLDPRPRGPTPISQKGPRDQPAPPGPTPSAAGTGLPGAGHLVSYGTLTSQSSPHPHLTDRPPNSGSSCPISWAAPSFPRPAPRPSRAAPHFTDWHPPSGITPRSPPLSFHKSDAKARDECVMTTPPFQRQVSQSACSPDPPLQIWSPRFKDPSLIFSHCPPHSVDQPLNSQTSPSSVVSKPRTVIW